MTGRRLRLRALAGVLALLAPVAPVLGPGAAASPIGGGDPLPAVPAPVVAELAASSAPGPRGPGARVRFEPNEGQFDPAADYRVGIGPEEIYLVDGGVIIDRSQGVDSHAIALTWTGADRQVTAEGQSPVGGRTSYFTGSDPAEWVTGVVSYSSVTYRDIYPGIDVDYLGVAGSFRYDLRVAPGADPTPIALAVEGADAVRIGGSGGLVIDRSVGPPLRFSAPLAYQETADGRSIVDSAYHQWPDGSFGFTVGDFDPALELVIDPTLEYSTYLGGGDVDQIHDIAADGTGAVYAVGAARLSYPTTVGAYQESAASGFDVVVTKMAPDGQSLVYSTYIGGDSDETGYAIAVDAGGNAYVTGETASDDFPTAGPPFDGIRDGVDAFATKLSADGSSLVYSTFLGGANAERGDGIAVDTTGSAYVVGRTESSDFPLQNPLDGTLGGSQDAFVARLNPSGGTLVYSTYLGGSSGDDAAGIVLDATAQAWVVGSTSSTDFPTTPGTYKPTRVDPSADVFLSGLAAGGGTVVYGTYLGGTSADRGKAIDIDSAGALYLTGSAKAGFPTTPGAWDTIADTGLDGFVAKIDPALTGVDELRYSGYLGGEGSDRMNAIAVDGSGRAHVAGETGAIGLATADGYDQVPDGTDAIMAIISADGSAKVYATYLGGAGTDVATGISLDGFGIDIGGYTDSPDFPLLNAYDSTAVLFDGWLARFTPLAPFTVNSTVDRVDQVIGDGACDTGFTVGPDPECTLRAAIQEANASAVDEIVVPAGTYTLTILGTGDDNAEKGDLDILDSLTITGAGAATTIIQAGTDATNGIDRVFDIKATATDSVSISGVTIRHGQEADGAGLRTVSPLAIEDAVVIDNTGTGSGGGVFVSGSVAALTIRATTLTGNAADDGGALMTKDGMITVEDSTISANDAGRRGGGVYTDGGALTVQRTVLDANATAGEDGGAINNLKGTVTITDSTISGNTGARRGGGVYNDSGPLTIERSLVAGNSAGSEDGGGILSRGGSAVLTVTNSTISGNSAGRDAGGVISDRPASILNSTVTLNSAAGVGGGLMQSSDVFELQNTIVAGNLSGGDCSGTLVSLGNNIDGGSSCGLSQPTDQTNTDPLLGPLQNNGGPTLTHALAGSSPAIDNGNDAAAPAVDQRSVARPLDGDLDAIPTSDIGAFELDPAEINQPPVASDDSATTPADTPVVIDVLANDTDPNGDPLTVDSVTQGGNGAVTNNGGDVTYSPNASWTGVDTFTYTVTDGNGGFDTAAVTVTVFSTTMVVNSTGDQGDTNAGDGNCDTGLLNSEGSNACTLRAAIEEVNANGAGWAIEFAMPATEPGHSGGIWTIAPGSALPPLATDVRIDATTQSGFTMTPVVELAGTSAGATSNGLTVAGDDAEIRGLAINRFGGDGILVQNGASGTLIAGNHIGTDPGGFIAWGNGDRGVDLTTGSGPTTVGGTALADRNLISGNGNDGIVIWQSDANTVIGNYIGTDVTGNAPLPNAADGIALGGTSSNNTIGQPGAGNVLSGNTNDGLEFDDDLTGNIARGNIIGLGADGDTIVANGRHGLVLYNGVNATQIGGAGAGDGNLISGNTASGLIIDGNGNLATAGNVIRGNLIGTDVTGSLPRGNGAAGIHLFASANTTAIGGGAASDGNVIAHNAGAGILITGAGTDQNSVIGNQITANGGIGIDLGAAGVTANDVGDADSGPNGLLNFPVLTGASELGGLVTVDFDLDVPAGDYRIDFFTNTAGADPSGYGEGESFAHAETITHTGSGSETFVATFAGADGDVLSATATVELAGPAYGSTSEFSLSRIVQSGSFVVNSTGDAADLIIGNGICETGTPGECTLRAAIAEANAAAGPDVIDFDIPAALVGGAHTITVSAGGLPPITGSVTIDGASEPDFAGIPVIELDGTATGVGVDGLYLDAGSDGSVITNLAINRFGRDGIQVWNSDGHVLTGNHIGTDVTGTLDRGNAGEGIRVTGQGISIGGTGAGDGNIIAGNDGNGIRIANGSDDLTIQGNRIGVGSGGESLGNAGHGISFGAFDSSGTLIGGDAAGSTNVIAHNGGAGVGSSGIGTGNAVIGNSIFDNAALGIDWNLDGVTANDPGDADTGFNGLSNFPVIARAAEITGVVTVDVDLDVPAGDYRIELFTNPVGPDPSGFGEGETLVQSFTVTHLGGGNQSFSSTLSGSIGDVLTATATLVLAGPTFASTSEFSPAAVVVDGFTATIAGSVLEDVDGDGDISVDGTGVGGVQVWVFADQGNGVPDAGDPIAATAVTDGAGAWSVVAGGNGTYWVAVDSTDVSAATGYNAAFGIDDVWAEQTYASAGAVTYDGTTHSFTVADGPLVGGMDPRRADGFPSLTDAEHLHRVILAGADVTGVETGFSFQVISTTGDEPGPGEFADVSAWEAFDPGASGVGVDPDGYRGIADDGRYQYFAPHGDGVTYHGEVLRYDSEGPFTDPASWAAFDPSANGIGTTPIGYGGALFDGRYLYFSPYGNRHGEVLRYDTQGSFTAPGSWSTFDPGAGGVGSDPDGYLGLTWDGRHVYFTPYDNGSGRHGEVLRYDTQGSFSSAGSWATFDPGANGVGGDPDGYVGATFDGTYVYFAPNHNGGGYHGEVLRYDTRLAFVAPSAWTTFDPGANGVGAIADGFIGAVLDGRYVYFVPSTSDTGRHGEVLRYDIAGSFTDPASWSAFDPGTGGVGTDPDGYRDATFDGRYLYLAPYDNGTGPHGEVLRFDTIGAFGDAAAWSTVDPGTGGVGTDPDGYSGALFDGRYVTFSPLDNGSGAHGEVLRHDTARAGQGSLRQFIDNANAITGVQTSRFAIPTTDPGYAAAPLSYTIQPAAALPVITDTVELDATSQSGFAGSPIVQLDGSQAGVAASGLTVDASTATVRGFVINRFSTGISVIGGAGNAIAGNFIGPDVTGTIGEVGNTDDGIRISGATGTIVGSSNPTDRNVISGNRLRGVFIDDFSDGVPAVSNGTMILGNYIGTDAAGSAALAVDGTGAAQQIGIAVWDGPANTFGGPAAGEFNVISGNEWYGIYLWGPNATGNAVQGNIVGLDAGGAVPVGNGVDDPATRAGIYISNAPGNLIGGVAPGEGNVIAGNDAHGVIVHNGGAVGNAIAGNEIHGNAGLGIDLGMNGVNPNDPLDPDAGANDWLNFPELANAVAAAGMVSVDVALDVPAGDYRLEFFTNPSGADPSGNGEGEVFRHAELVTHPGSGRQSYTVSLPGVGGERLTVTATESAGTSLGSTSELSAYALVAPAGARIQDASVRRSDLREVGTVPSVPGVAGSGFEFSAGSDRLLGPAVDIVSGQLTLSAWVNPDTLGTDPRVLAKAATAGDAVYELFIDDATAEAVARLTVGGATVEVRGGVVTPGTWQQLTATWDGTTIVLYVDGVAVDSMPAAGSIATDLGLPVAAGNLAAADRGLDGTLDHVWIGHAAWSNDRVATAFNNVSDPASFVTIGGPQTGVPGAWTVSTAVSRSGGNALQAPPTASGSAAWATATTLDEPGIEFEAWWLLSDPGSVEVAGGSRTGAVPTDQNEAGLIGGLFDLATLRNGTRTQDATSATGAAAGTWVNVMFRTDETGSSSLTIDDVPIIGPIPHAAGESTGSVGLRAGELPIGMTWHIDDIRLRRLVSDEPVATLGPLDRN